jgi:RNA polymerase sigma-70 factor (ECF subfamily)
MASTERASDDVAAIFLTLGGAVHAYLRASAPAESEDLLSEVFLEVTRSLHRFRGDDDALRRWVFTIAHHRLVDEQRRAVRRRRVIQRQRPPTTPPPDEPFDPALFAALQTLTPEQREVVTLRFVADLDLETVAVMTQRSVGAVKSLQHRALQQLAAVLAQREIAPIV